MILKVDIVIKFSWHVHNNIMKIYIYCNYQIWSPRTKSIHTRSLPNHVMASCPLTPSTFATCSYGKYLPPTAYSIHLFLHNAACILVPYDDWCTVTSLKNNCKGIFLYTLIIKITKDMTKTILENVYATFLVTPDPYSWIYKKVVCMYPHTK